jgi:hypothetical protein
MSRKNKIFFVETEVPVLIWFSIAFFLTQIPHLRNENIYFKHLHSKTNARHDVYIEKVNLVD